jgi:transglutaminase-like putative cysteine protease
MSTVVALLISLGMLTPGSVGSIDTDGFIEREVAFSETIACAGPTDAGRATKLRCVAAIPESSARQEVSLEWISPGCQLVRDSYGNLLLSFEHEELSPGQSIELGWRARVRLRAGIHKVDSTRLASMLAIPEEIAARYLADGDAYKLDDPLLKEVAERARAVASDPLDLAFRLNELVREHLSYERDAAWDPAPKVWRRGSGSCSEYHFVFANLCRNAGLPVRYVGASALRSGDDDYVDTVFHRWSEVWLPGYGWYPVDVSRNDCEDGGAVNDAFGCTSCNLLELMRGDGGDDSPLGWSYVANVKALSADGASLRARRRIEWTPAGRETLPPLPLATLIGR